MSLYIFSVIKLAGVDVPRVCLPDVAERLIHAGYNATASKLLDASAQGRPQLELNSSERGELLAVLENPPAGLTELWRVLREERSAEAPDVGGQDTLGAIDAVPAAG